MIRVFFTAICVMITVLPIECVFKRYVPRCASHRLERFLRAKEVCGSITQYHCLYGDDWELVEICQDFKQLPPGNLPKYSNYGDDLYYDPCRPERYQPVPVASYQITDCLFIKSTCSSEGQVPCSAGTTSTDVTCRCDYKNGYAMVHAGCCSPTLFDDCSCYRKPCPAGKELGPDYICIDKCQSGLERRAGKQHCSIKDPTNITGAGDVTENVSITVTPMIEDLYDIVDIGYQQNLSAGSAYIICQLMIFVISIGLFYRVYKRKGGDYWKLAILSFSIFLGLNIPEGVLSILYDRNVFFKYAITSRIIMAIIGCICGIFTVLSYHIRKRFSFYTEDYELKLYNVLQAAKDGDLNRLQSLFDEKAVDIDEVDYDQRSALHLAASEGHYDVVKFLLDNNLCNPLAKDRNLCTAVDYAKKASSENKHLVEILISSKGKKTLKESELFRERKFRELQNAAKDGHISELERLKHNNTIMDLCNSSGKTALHVAVENGMEEIVNYLIDKCHVSPFVWWTGKQPIDCIPLIENEKTRNIREKLTKYMKDRENDTTYAPASDPNDSESTQVVRMFNAASRGELNLLKHYLEIYDKRLSNYDGRTVLHIAVIDRQNHIVDHLLTDDFFRDTMKNHKDRWGKTPFMVAKEADDDQIYYTFLKHCKELFDTENDEYRTYKLLTAGAKGDVETLKRLHHQKVDMDLRNYDGRTALHLAAAENKIAAVKFLLEEAKVKPSIPDRENRKPADIPYTYANNEVIQMIKEAESNCTKSDDQHFACNEKLVTVMNAASRGVLKKLEKKDYRFAFFPMDSFDYMKNTPLHVAAAKAMKEDVEYLLEKNVSPFVRNSFWETPLMLVEKKRDYWKNRFKCLSDVAKGKGSSDYAKCRMEKFEEVLNMLKEAEEISKTELRQEDLEFVKYSDEEKIFLFLNKAYKGDVNAIRRYLITDKDLINKQDYDKRTALHLAVAEGHLKLVNFLLQQGSVNKDIEDRWGLSALNEAKKTDDKDMIEALVFKQGR